MSEFIRKVFTSLGARIQNDPSEGVFKYRKNIVTLRLPPSVRHALNDKQQEIYAEVFDTSLRQAPADFSREQKHHFAHQNAWSVARRRGLTPTSSGYSMHRNKRS
ncbi:MAG: hypothetical protein Q8Q18_00140 [bacterium]|nr:hypothetical protein [bacterium]